MEGRDAPAEKEDAVRDAQVNATLREFVSGILAPSWWALKRVRTNSATQRIEISGI
jgi:hypothetical protein